MKITIEIAKKPNKNDLLIYDGESFCPIQKNKLLEELRNELKECDCKHLRNENSLRETQDVIQEVCKALLERIKAVEKEIRIIEGEEDEEN